MSDYKRDFKGIWIPKEIWLNKQLGWTEKILLVEIESLDNKDGCYASNEHFASFFNLSKDRISKIVSSLRDMGYIDVQMFYKEGSKQIEKRIIRVNKEKYNSIVEKDGTYMRKQLEGIGENNYTPIGENAKGNNTSFNNTINNINNIKDFDLTEIHFKKFWDVYNKKQDIAKARKSFAKVIKKHDINTIIEHTLRYLDFLQAKYGNFKYQKMASTFLNNFDLEDDFTVNKKVNEIKQGNTNWEEMI